MEYTSEVNFFSNGFFGYSSTTDFHMGSFWHFLPIVLMIISIILIYRFRKQIRNYKYEGRIRYILAFVMIMVEMSYFWRLLYVGSQGKYPDMMGYLPIQLCQWGLIICVFTLMSKNQKLFNINFYVTLLFASVALGYPLVIKYTGPTYYRYYQFWLEHILPIISVFYLMFVNEMKPTYKGILDTFILIVPLTTVCAIANHYIPDANYLYLRLEVPLLPPGQLYRIPILSLITFILFSLMYYIYYLINKRTIKENKKSYNKQKGELFMEHKEIVKRYSINKSTAIMIMIQMILTLGAMALCIYGIYSTVKTAYSLNRVIIYAAQAVTCFAIVLFGTYYFNKKDTRYFKTIALAYALVEAVRVSLLHTGGINELAAFGAKFTMVLLVLDSALLFEKMDKKEGLIISLVMVGLEFLLYAIFLIGFPAVRTRLLFMLMPLVGVLMAGSMCMFVTGRLEQIEYAKQEELAKAEKPKKVAAKKTTTKKTTTKKTTTKKGR